MKLRKHTNRQNKHSAVRKSQQISLLPDLSSPCGEGKHISKGFLTNSGAFSIKWWPVYSFLLKLGFYHSSFSLASLGFVLLCSYSICSAVTCGEWAGRKMPRHVLLLHWLTCYHGALNQTIFPYCFSLAITLQYIDEKAEMFLNYFK